MRFAGAWAETIDKCLPWNRLSFARCWNMKGSDPLPRARAQTIHRSDPPRKPWHPATSFFQRMLHSAAVLCATPQKSMYYYQYYGLGCDRVKIRGFLKQMFEIIGLFPTFSPFHFQSWLLHNWSTVSVAVGTPPQIIGLFYILRFSNTRNNPIISYMLLSSWGMYH